MKSTTPSGNLRRWALRSAAAVALGLATAAVAVQPAAAHPLGNFTVNRYARVEVGGASVRVYYVLDEAEIPTFQDRDALDADRDRFVRNRIDDIRRHLSLTVAGSDVPLVAGAQLLTFPPGQGGLPTLRLAVRFDGVLPTSVAPETRVAARFADTNEPDRIGWREIIVVRRADARIVDSEAPTRDVSDELRHYPADLLQAPLDLRSAGFTFTPGSASAPLEPLRSPTAAPSRAGGSFTDLVKRQGIDLPVLLGMLGVALLFGAGHALAPGHGKTVMAAYLVGTRGRPIDAVLVGVVVSAMHTFSVLALAFVLYEIGSDVSPDRAYPWLTLASGVAVCAIGAWLLVSRTRRLRAARALVPPAALDEAELARELRPALVAAGPHHHHDAGTNDHGHGHGHDHDHAHAHDHADVHDHGGHAHTHELPEGVAPLSRRGLVVLATSGGILPSPSALIVLLAALTSGRALLGLTLVAAFSIGLAATLTAVGLALVFGSRAMTTRVSGRLLRVVPIVGAAAVVVLGLVLVEQGLQRV